MDGNREPGFSESIHWSLLRQDYILAKIIPGGDLPRVQGEIEREMGNGEYTTMEVVLASDAVECTRFHLPMDAETHFQYIKRTEAERGDPPIFWPNREYLGEDGENHQINSIIGGSCFLVGNF